LSGYEKLIDDAMATTSDFVRALAEIPVVQFASTQEMNIPTFRLNFGDDSRNDALNRSFNEYALEKHNIFFSLPTFKGQLWQRTILLNPFIDHAVIRKVVSCIRAFEQEVT
jgi:glutamate/tyrosine decarboxylase-like PLP-dependent enzyme